MQVPNSMSAIPRPPSIFFLLENPILLPAEIPWKLELMTVLTAWHYHFHSTIGC